MGDTLACTGRDKTDDEVDAADAGRMIVFIDL
jgi:hypothetical protein